MADRHYQIFETRQYVSDLKRFDPPVCSRVQKKLQAYVYPQLRMEPHVGLNIQKLKGWVPETWRYRIGDWRFFYEVQEKEKRISMTAISHRREAYR